MISRIRALTPMGMMVIMFVVLIGISTFNTVTTNINSLDTKNVVVQLNETATTNRQISNLTSELRTAQIQDIQEQQNRTAELLPIFFKNFNQTDQMLNATNEMLGFIKFISDSFDEEYLIDEIRQYKQSNNTHGNLTVLNEKLDIILENLGPTSNGSIS